MGIVAKTNGEPRRVIDYRALNKATLRQTHTTGTPFKAASRIPLDTWKTTIDAKDGYHSVPLDPAHYHYTAFNTQ